MNRNILIILSFCLLVSCTSQKKQINAEKQIPGTYNYEHSWDYKAPDGNGKIHCDEQGTLRFYADGTYVDDAMQCHKLKMDSAICVKNFKGEIDTIDGCGFNYIYHCVGRWRVKDGKFLFNEMSEGFSMELRESTKWSEWFADYSASIVEHTIPNSDRWFTFDIERLDKEWFIWSYTYPNGRKDTWDMQRVKPNEGNFGEAK